MILDLAKAAIATRLNPIRLALAPYLIWAKLFLVLAVVVALTLAVVRVGQWRSAYHRLQAAETALATSTAELQQCTAAATAAALAYAGAVQRAEKTAATDRATAQRIEGELQTKIATVDTGARALARRLHDDQARRCSGTVPATADTAFFSPPASGEPDDLGAAEEDHFAACARDAARLDGWLEWYTRVKASRATVP